MTPPTKSSSYPAKGARKNSQRPRQRQGAPQPPLTGKKNGAVRARSYQPRRRALIKKLGGRCVWPLGCKEKRAERLQFDHKNPTEVQLNKMSRWTRIAYYEREAKVGRLQVLCKYHNQMKGARSMLQLLSDLDIVPF